VGKKRRSYHGRELNTPGDLKEKAMAKNPAREMVGWAGGEGKKGPKTGDPRGGLLGKQLGKGGGRKRLRRHQKHQKEQQGKRGVLIRGPGAPWVNENSPWDKIVEKKGGKVKVSPPLRATK